MPEIKKIKDIVLLEKMRDAGYSHLKRLDVSDLEYGFVGNQLAVVVEQYLKIKDEKAGLN